MASPKGIKNKYTLVQECYIMFGPLTPPSSSFWTWHELCPRIFTIPHRVQEEDLRLTGGRGTSFNHRQVYFWSKGQRILFLRILDQEINMSQVWLLSLCSIHGFTTNPWLAPKPWGAAVSVGIFKSLLGQWWFITYICVYMLGNTLLQDPCCGREKVFKNRKRKGDIPSIGALIPLR